MRQGNRHLTRLEPICTSNETGATHKHDYLQRRRRIFAVYALTSHESLSWEIPRCDPPCPCRRWE
jgi:hypothetical protein